MNSLDKNTIKSAKYGHLNLAQRISVAAHMVANGEVVSFRGASADTYLQVERLANRIKLEKEFPSVCPCGECD